MTKINGPLQINRPLQGKVLLINVYSVFDSVKDVEWVIDKAELLSAQIINENKESLY